MATTRSQLTFNKPSRVCFFKPDGTKVIYTLPRDPQTDAIVDDIHATDPEAVIMMRRNSDGRIHIIPGKNEMTDDARNALMADVDAWLGELDTAHYTGENSTPSFGVACANGGCIIQMPKKEKLSATFKANTRAAILGWTQNATTTTPGAAPAPSDTPTPADGATTPSDTPAPAPADETPAPALSPGYVAGVNAFRDAYEALGGNPVSYKKGQRI